MKMLLPKRKGFTLIELLIVIVIIGILAVGFAPSLLNAPKKARDGVRKGQVASIQQAIEMYALDKAGYLATGDGCFFDPTKDPGALLLPYFQQGIPVDKSSAATGAECKGFGYKNDGTYYYISVKLETSTTAGNSKVAADTAVGTTVIKDGEGQFYLVRVKY